MSNPSSGNVGLADAFAHAEPNEDMIRQAEGGLKQRVAQLEAQLQEKTAELEEHESIIKSLKIEIQDIQFENNFEPTLQSLSAKSSSEDAVRCADTSTLSFLQFFS